MLRIIVLCCFIFINPGDGARILAAVYTPSYSHQVAFRPLWKELDKRGHEIVLITTDPMKDPELNHTREIDVSMSYDIMNKHNHRDLLTKPPSALEFIRKYIQALHDVGVAQMEHPEVVELINGDYSFDLLIVEVTFPIHLSFLERWKVPLIGLMSLEASRRLHEVMGNIVHPITNPETMLGMQPPLTFRQRFISFLEMILMRYHAYYVLHPKEDATVRKVFGNNSKTLWELTEQMDMLFTNVNPIFHQKRAIVPNTVLIGGATHLTSPKPLPDDINEFLSDSKGGVIYFSLGTNVKSSLMEERTKKVILTAFRNLKQKVLWKFEDENLPGLPSNVMIKQWVPQLDVLRHPNVIIFITQCGLQSIEEAIATQVPMIGLPFNGDQFGNAAIVAKKGFGLTLDSKTMSVEEFQTAIEDVLSNSSYKEALLESWNLMNDVEMTGLEKAVWWTEYVIRNKGAKLFRNPVLDVPYYQYFLLDVIAFIFVVVFILTYGSVKLALLVIRKLKKC